MPHGARRSHRVGCFRPPLPPRGRKTSRQPSSAANTKRQQLTPNCRIRKNAAGVNVSASAVVSVRQCCCHVAGAKVTFCNDDFFSSGNVVAMLLGLTFHQGDLYSSGDVTAVLLEPRFRRWHLSLSDDVAGAKISSRRHALVRQCCFHSSRRELIFVR